MDNIEKYCKEYFDNYNKNYRKAWLLLREKRYQKIVEKGFYLSTDAETFKNEVMKFWEGKDGVKGWSDRNSWIKKKNSDEWILFHDKQANIPEYEKIVENLNNNSLDLCGNYSWSKLNRGGDKFDITKDWKKLQNTLKYLLNLDEEYNFKKEIDAGGVFNRFDETVRNNNKTIYKIRGLGNSKTSMFLHIRNSKEYGVWNGCTDTAFKIFSEGDDNEEVKKKFKIREANIGEKYKIINKQLKWLLEKYEKKDENSSYGFKNLSDVDIFVWYVANKC